MNTPSKIRHPHPYPVQVIKWLTEVTKKCAATFSVVNRRFFGPSRCTIGGQTNRLLTAQRDTSCRYSYPLYVSSVRQILFRSKCRGQESQLRDTTLFSQSQIIFSFVPYTREMLDICVKLHTRKDYARV